MLVHNSQRVRILGLIGAFTLLILCLSNPQGNFDRSALAATANGSMVSRIIATMLGGYGGVYRFYISSDGASHKFGQIQVPAISDFYSRDMLLAQGFDAGPGGKLEYQSSDGNRRLFVSTTHDTTGLTTLAVAVSNADGSNPQSVGKLTGLAFIVPPGWSPDNTRVLITELVADTTHQETLQLKFHILSLDGTHQEQVVTPDRPVSFPAKLLMEAMPFIGNHLAFWTPDGNQILTEGNLNYQSDRLALTIMDNDGKNVRSFLADGSKSIFNASWSPDGKHLVFQYTENISSGTSGIAISNTDGSNAQLLTKSIMIYFPVWSPDSSQIAYLSQGTDPNLTIWLMNADGTNQHQIFDVVRDGQASRDSGTTPYDLSWKLVPEDSLTNMPSVAPTITPTPAS